MIFLKYIFKNKNDFVLYAVRFLDHFSSKIIIVTKNIYLVSILEENVFELLKAFLHGLVQMDLERKNQDSEKYQKNRLQNHLTKH